MLSLEAYQINGNQAEHFNVQLEYAPSEITVASIHLEWEVVLLLEVWETIYRVARVAQLEYAVFPSVVVVEPAKVEYAETPVALEVAAKVEYAEIPAVDKAVAALAVHAAGKVDKAAAAPAVHAADKVDKVAAAPAVHAAGKAGKVVKADKAADRPVAVAQVKVV